MTGRSGPRYVRVRIEHEVEVFDELALRGAALEGDGENYTGLPQDGAPDHALEAMRGMTVAQLVADAMGPGDHAAARGRLERAGIRWMSSSSMPATLDPADPDQYLGTPPMPARRDDGTFSFEDQDG